MAPRKSASKQPATRKRAASKKKATTKTSEVASAKGNKEFQRSAAICAPDLGFDILDGNADVFDNAAQVLGSVIGRRKNQSIGFASAADIRQNVLWVPEFELQHLMGIVGIPHGSFLEIIAPEGVGKTSMALTIGGWAMNAGAPVVYCECEGKQMPKHRIIRMLHPNPKRAALMLDRLRVERIASLTQLDQFIIDYADVMRGRKSLKDYPISIPQHVPLVIIVDPWSRLMNDDEAAMFYDYGGNMDTKTKKFKQTATGSNLGHAKFAHAWCRRLAYLVERDNIILILNQHQTEDLKEAMAQSYGPKIILPESVAGLENKNHIGGRALHQLASQQWVMVKRGLAKYADKTNSGKNVNLSMAKNSFGPEKRKMYFEIRGEHRGDMAGVYIEPALQFANSFTKWFTKEKLLGSKVDTSGDTYTCEDLGVRAVDEVEFHRAFHANTELKKHVGNLLQIEGYVDTVERIRQDITARDEADIARQNMPQQGDGGPVRPDFTEFDASASDDEPTADE
jgi:RecA/RadA recombinase